MRLTAICSACGPGLLAKAGSRRKPVKTAVGRYVTSKLPALTRRVHRVLRAQAKLIAGAVRDTYVEKLAKDVGPKVDLVDSILAALDFEEVGVTIDGALEGAMLAAFRRAAQRGAMQVGFDMTEGITEQVDGKAVAYADRHGGELIKDLAGTTRDDMRGLLERAVEEGLSVDDLAEEVMQLGAFSEYRAERIARTELAFAHVQGNVEGWRQSGVVAGKRWVLADTHPKPDECDEAAEAGVVGLDDEFLPGIRFPPDPHPNCLCDVEPVLSEEGDDDAQDDRG